MPAKRVSKAKWNSMSLAQRARLKSALGISGGGAYKMGTRRISGRGSYNVNSKKTKNYSYDKPGAFGKTGRLLGAAAGGYLGGPVGAAIGSKVGGLAHYIGKIFGSGDYVASPPVESNSVLSPQIPTFSSGTTSIRVKHREFLGDVYSSSTANSFDVNSYRINPGLVQSFPWLSDVCGGSFQQYRLNGCVYEFRSMSNDGGATTNLTTGSVVMCTDYDSADAPFTSKQQMENTEFGVSCKPQSNMIHAIECAPQLTSVSEKYIRAYANPSGTDIRLYDMGRFYIATNGFQGTSVNCGELWVSYDITLMKAIEQPPAYLTPFSQFNLIGVDATHALGTSQTTVVNQIPVTITYDAGTAYVILPSDLQTNSKYSIYYGIFGTSTASVATISPVYTNGLAGFASGMYVPYDASQTSSFRGFYQVFIYDGSGTPGLPPTIAVPGGVMPANPTISTLNISQISSLYVVDGQ